jgi:arsenite methyltransferase
MSTVTRRLDTSELEDRVKRMYKEVALEPEHEFHFETGRPLAERLGYPPADLDRIPAAAIDSFAGVGHFLDLAAITPGETVLDLGSGSGTDSFLAALATGTNGQVIGIDMTHQQLAKARRLAAEAAFMHVRFRNGYIERPPVDDASIDCVISNGVTTSHPTSRPCSPPPRARCALADASRSPTSSQPSSCPKA